MPINLLTTQQLAVRLGLASITLHIWRSKGVGLPFQKIGPRVFYRLEDVQAYERCQVADLIEQVLVEDKPLPKLRSMLHSTRMPRHRLSAAGTTSRSVGNTDLSANPLA